MQLEQAEPRLRELIRERGVDLTDSKVGDAGKVWEAFNEFAALPVEDPRLGSGEEDGDGLLFETGVYDWGDGPSFQWSLTRQFIVNEDGEYDHMQQLKLTVHFDRSDELENLAKVELWSFGMSVSEWRSEVEAQPAFGFPDANALTPTRIELSQEAV